MNATTHDFQQPFQAALSAAQAGNYVACREARQRLFAVVCDMQRDRLHDSEAAEALRKVDLALASFYD